MRSHAPGRGKSEAINGVFCDLRMPGAVFFLILSPYLFSRKKAKADQFWGRADFTTVWEHRTAFIVLSTLFVTTIPD